MGHMFKIVAQPFFPLTGYTRNSEEPGTTVTLIDSVDLRMLNSFITHANFT